MKEVIKMNEMKKFEDMDCEELKTYCPWEHEPVFCTGGLPIMCEGKYCEEAYENYLDDYLDNLDYENNNK